VSVSSQVNNYLKGFRDKVTPLPTRRHPQESQTASPKSFGVYLGSLDSPPSRDQLQLLQQWDVLVVDPLQEGVVRELVCNTPTSSHVLARLDVSALVKADTSLGDDEVIKNLQAFLEVATTRAVWRAESEVSPFTGLVLANFIKYFPPTVLNELVHVIQSLGFDLWLELSYPDYLGETEARNIDMKLIQGIIYRNATIRTDGNWQNYFHMSALRTVMRAVAYQTVGLSLPMAIWETIEDGRELQYAAVARCYKLCTFYNSMCWVGHRSALMDAGASKTHAMQSKPLGALMWLKDESNMKAHNMWLGNDEVCEQYSKSITQGQPHFHINIIVYRFAHTPGITRHSTRN
jgi:hypothetical protein